MEMNSTTDALKQFLGCEFPESVSNQLSTCGVMKQVVKSWDTQQKLWQLESLSH